MHAAVIGSLGASTGQLTTSGTAQKVVSQNNLKRGLLIANHDATNAIFLGVSSAVTTSTGFRLGPGQMAFLPIASDLYAISITGTPVLSYIDIIN